MQRPAFTCPRCGTPSWSLADGLAGYCGLCRAVTGWVPARFTCPRCARTCLPPERGCQGAVACARALVPAPAPPLPGEFARMAACGHLDPLEMGRRPPAALMDELSAYGRRAAPLQVTVNQFPRNLVTDSRGLIQWAPSQDPDEPWCALGYPLDDSARWMPGDAES